MFQKKYSFDDLVGIMNKLRSENGCPWDKEQTHDTLLPFLIEESHEFIDAVHQADRKGMEEELGDVLLQVVFHAQIATESSAFTIDDIITGICSKMIHRHPHVFGDKEVNTAQEVLKEWDKIKAKEKAHTRDSALDGVAQSLPALSLAAELQKKAAKVGFDWPDDKGPREKILEELQEFIEALESGDRSDSEEELGDLLFSIVNLARKRGLSGEVALRRTNQKFEARFRKVEELAGGLLHKKQVLPLEQLDEYWEQAKKLLSKKVIDG
jgi:tetrapyrrole methylase family protein / MazG family protein